MDAVADDGDAGTRSTSERRRGVMLVIPLRWSSCCGAPTGRCMIIAGDQVARDDARAELEQLRAVLQARVATVPDAKDVAVAAVAGIGRDRGDGSSCGERRDRRERGVFIGGYPDAADGAQRPG